MTDNHKCPKCDARLKLGRVKHHATFDEKRRDCPKCGYGDKVHVRIQEEILAIIEVAKRKRVFRKRTFGSTQRAKPRNTKTKRGPSC